MATDMSEQKPVPMETLHLGSGTNTRATAWNVDRLNHDGVDEVVDLSDYPWPWGDESWQFILAEHVFEHLPDMAQTLRECARILEPGGQVEIAMPIGQDGWADPDHKHRWTFDTPEMYCGARPWDVDTGLSVVEKSVEVWPHAPGLWNWAYGGLLHVAQRHYPANRWLFDLPATSGEFRVVFEK